VHRRLLVFAAVVAASLLLVSQALAARSSLRQVRVVTSLTGTHVWYQQVVAGHPVIGGYVLRNFDRVGRPLATIDRRKLVNGRLVAPTRSLASAGRMLAVLPGHRARLVFETYTPTARVLVDARSGRVLSRETAVKYATGQGTAFPVNPVVALGNESLTDQKDSDFAAIQGAYKSVQLNNLDGSGYLRGRYVDVQGTTSTAFNAQNQFFSHRDSDTFEQVDAYWAVESAQEYIQRLGFTNINTDSQHVKVNQLGVDNSYYSPQQDVIKFGKGGVDDAEDVEVIWHELGHAIQDSQVKDFGATHDGGSIGEGWGDFWALTMSEQYAPNADLPCLMDWDSTSYTSTVPHCIRRTDTNLTLADQTGEVHHDGQIWSRALWDIHNQLGRDVTARIVLESQYTNLPDETWSYAAQQVVKAAQKLYGTRAANAARHAFLARGISVS
jgi:Fungalysin metallopeptidase (M36)/Fungalysin/Thermolysin Propeptide Motif